MAAFGLVRNGSHATALISNDHEGRISGTLALTDVLCGLPHTSYRPLLPKWPRRGHRPERRPSMIARQCAVQPETLRAPGRGPRGTAPTRSTFQVAAGDDDARSGHTLRELEEKKLAQKLRGSVALVHIPVGHFLLVHWEKGACVLLFELAPGRHVRVDEYDAVSGVLSLLSHGGEQQREQDHIRQKVDLYILLVTRLAMESFRYLEDPSVQNGQVKSLQALGPFDKGNDGIVR